MIPCLISARAATIQAKARKLYKSSGSVAVNRSKRCQGRTDQGRRGRLKSTRSLETKCQMTDSGERMGRLTRTGTHYAFGRVRTSSERRRVLERASRDERLQEQDLGAVHEGQHMSSDCTPSNRSHVHMRGDIGRDEVPVDPAFRVDKVDRRRRPEIAQGLVNLFELGTAIHRSELSVGRYTRDGQPRRLAFPSASSGPALQVKHSIGTRRR